MESRACRKCRYELRGLRIGANCPECGEPIRSRARKFNAREGTITDADPHYVSVLRWGFVAMSFGILLSILGAITGQFRFGFGLLISLVASAAWCGGVFLISNPRPPEFDELAEPVLDNPKMRLLVRSCGAVWVVYTLVNGGYEALARAKAAGGGNGLLEGVMLVLAILAGVGAYLSLIPLCIFVSDMAFWMSDDTGGWRLRGAAWTMAVFGTLNLLFTGLGVAGIEWMLFFAVWFSIIVLIANLVFGMAVLGCAQMASFALRYQEQIEGRAERISAKIMQKTSQQGGTIGFDMDCRACGYNLRGLPNGGACPECGLSYADITPAPLRREQTWRPEDNEAIDVDESAAALPIIARMPSIGKDPRAGSHRQQIPPVDDDRPIPLSMGDDPVPDVSGKGPRDAFAPAPFEGDEDLPGDLQSPASAGDEDDSIPLADEDDDRAG